LQLANFWQDVSRDSKRDASTSRSTPLPCTASPTRTFVNRRFDDRYINLMKDLIARTRRTIRRRRAAREMVDSRLSIDLDMFSRGGLAVLDASRLADTTRFTNALPSAKASKPVCSAARWLLIS